MNKNKTTSQNSKQKHFTNKIATGKITNNNKNKSDKFHSLFKKTYKVTKNKM